MEKIAQGKFKLTKEEIKAIHKLSETFDCGTEIQCSECPYVLGYHGCILVRLEDITDEILKS